MCHSASVSLGSFTIGAIFSYLLYRENDISYKMLGVFLGYIILMQLIEFLLWSHQVCDNYNKSISFLGMYLNYLQPFVLAILLLYFFNQPKFNKNIIITTASIYLVITLLYTSQYYFNLDKCTIKKNNPYLLWNWGQMNYSYAMSIIYLIALFVLIYFGVPNKTAAFGIIFLSFITLLFSVLFYPRPFIGAIWCFFGAFIPLMFYIYKKLIIDYKLLI